MRKGFTPIIILLAILVIAAIAGAFYLRTKNTTILDTEWNVNNSPSPSSSSDLTANWKTYTLNFKTFTVSLKSPIAPQNKASFKEYKDGAITISDTPNFDLPKIPTCPEPASNSKVFCQIPSNCPKEAVDCNDPIYIGNKQTARIFKIYEPTYNSVISVVKMVGPSPILEVAQAIDGAGLDEQLTQILSTFKFTQ